MGMGVYGEKDFWKRYVFSSEWKSEGVMDDDSADSEEDEGEEDWLRQGWRSETGSLFQRWGDVGYIHLRTTYLSLLEFSASPSLQTMWRTVEDWG